MGGSSVIRRLERKKLEWAEQEAVQRRAAAYAMLFAAQVGDFRVTQWAIEKMGANPNTRESTVLPSVHSALRYVSITSARDVAAHKKTVEVLLDHGADVNMRDHEGRGALAAAIDRGCVEIVELLLDRGAAITDVDRVAGGRNVIEYVADQRGRDERIVDVLRNRYPVMFLDIWTAMNAPTLNGV
jgi:hypothetical protein